MLCIRFTRQIKIANKIKCIIRVSDSAESGTLFFTLRFYHIQSAGNVRQGIVQKRKTCSFETRSVK